MSLFRRKLEDRKAPGESRGAALRPYEIESALPVEPEVAAVMLSTDEQSSQSDRVPTHEPPPPAGSPVPRRRELSRGALEAPLDGTLVNGIVEVEARLAENAAATDFRLDWSLDGAEWKPLAIPGDDYELRATRGGETPSRIALVRSIELSEKRKRALEQAGYEQVEVVPARPSSWQDGLRLLGNCDMRELPEGACLLQLVTIAGSGKEIASDPVIVLVDNLGPKLSLREQIAGEVLTGPVTLVAEAEDAISGVSVVELELDDGGESWRPVAVARQRPFALLFDSEEFEDGSYRLRIAARDGSGNVSHSESWEIEVVNPGSAVELVDPGEFLSRRINLIARASYRHSTQMIFEIAARGSDDWRALGTSRPPFHLPVDTRQFVDGVYELRIESVSAGGKSTYSRSYGPYIVDNTPPTVEIVQPLEGSELRGWAKLTANVGDETSGLARVELSYSEGDEWRPLAELEPKGGEVRGFWQTETRQPGHCHLRATAYDRAGNEASHIIGVTIASTSFAFAPQPAEAETPAPEPEPELEKAFEPGEESEPEQEGGYVPEEPRQEIRLVEPLQGKDAANAEKKSTEGGSEEAEDEKKSEKNGSASPEGGRLVNFPRVVRGWDIWALSELVEETAGQDPAREEERRQILFYLRGHSAVDGRIPSQFEDLIYETFGDLIPDDSTA